MLESKYLKDDIQNIQKLMAIPALRNFETKNLGKLLRLSKIRKYENGEAIIKEGDRDNWLYFLLSGEIRIEKEDVEIATSSKTGEMFGEMRLIDNLSRSASVFAKGQTVVLAVDTTGGGRTGLNDERAEFLFLLYRMFAEYTVVRLRLTNEELIAAKKRLGENL
ncbi:MAG: cyclic nucleotide-binding domain-containing protein [Desulfobacterales bacterium]|jgi:signal-transduction protein with cAMP-binding, CBS, and nucleotidyltransferase domain